MIDPAARDADRGRHLRRARGAWFPDLRVVYDGRNSLRDLALPDGVAYVGVDAQASTRRLEA